MNTPPTILAHWRLNLRLHDVPVRADGSAKERAVCVRRPPHRQPWQLPLPGLATGEIRCKDCRRIAERDA